MSCGPITRACRVFLSRRHIYPGQVSRALIRATPRTGHGLRRGLQLQGRSARTFIANGDDENNAYLEFHPTSGNTLLKVTRERYWYREQGNGLADLVLLGRQVPDALCVALERDRHRLAELVEHSHDPFYLRSNPPVRRMRNARRLGRPALVLTLVPVWAEKNWGYSDGLSVWRE